MDLPKMRQVVAIHRFGSFAKAADALGMSQPSLSRSISRLEDELKIKIFDRTAAGSALTPVGEMVIERLERVLSDTEDLIRDATLMAGGESGFVRIGVTSALRGPFVRDFMLKLVSAHPNLRVHTELNNRVALIPLVQARELDVVLTLEREAVEDASLVVTKVADLDFLALAGPTHPLAGRRAVSFQEFARHRYAGPSVALVRQFFNVTGDDLAPFYTSNDHQTLFPLVQAGLATMVAPACLVRPMIDAGQLVALDVDWPIDLDLVAVTTRASATAPIIAKIIDYAREVAALLEGAAPPAPGLRYGDRAR
jgi:DNA-binding transcriptional LysR family regulator